EGGGCREGEEGRERGGAAGERGVEVEGAKILEDLRRRPSPFGDQRGGNAMARVGKKAAGMGEDDLQVGMAAYRSALHESIGGPGGIEQEVRGERRDALDARARQLRRVNEDHRPSPVQLGEQRLVPRRAPLPTVGV